MTSNYSESLTTIHLGTYKQEVDARITEVLNAVLLAEEDVLESGHCTTLDPILLCVLRTALAAMNASVLVCSFATRHSIQFHLVWEMNIQAQMCSVETWALAMTSIA